MGKFSYKKIKMEEVIAYECHVKGVSFDESSNVKNRGSFLGLIEKLDDIKSLGVNQLIVMPVYDFNENLEDIYGVPEDISVPVNGKKNYWGFSEGDYFSLKKEFVSESEDDFLLLVNEVHKREMELVMMIHYPENINTELMLNSLNFWYDNYSVDGFFLNVNPYYLKMVSDCSNLKDIKLYTYAYDSTLAYTNPERIAVYDTGLKYLLRRLVKGDEGAFCDYLNYLRQTHKVKHIVSITSHNGFTLYDLYSYLRKHNESNGENNRDGENMNFGDNCGTEGDTDSKEINALRLKMMKNALLMLLLSKGVPMLLAGDEEANSQKGNNNPYCQDNEISWIQYGHPFSNELRCFISQICKIRKKTSIFSMENEFIESKVNDNFLPRLSVHTDTAWDCRVDRLTKYGSILYADDEYSLCISMNFDKYNHILSIPHLPKGFKWSIIAGTDIDSDLISDCDILLAGQSIMIFEGIKEY